MDIYGCLWDTFVKEKWKYEGYEGWDWLKLIIWLAIPNLLNHGNYTCDSRQPRKVYKAERFEPIWGRHPEDVQPQHLGRWVPFFVQTPSCQLLENAKTNHVKGFRVKGWCEIRPPREMWLGPAQFNWWKPGPSSMSFNIRSLSSFTDASACKRFLTGTLHYLSGKSLTGTYIICLIFPYEKFMGTQWPLHDVVATIHNMFDLNCHTHT